MTPQKPNAEDKHDGGDREQLPQAGRLEAAALVRVQAEHEVERPADLLTRNREVGVEPGETDSTGTFTLMEMECLGACDRAPVVMVNNEHWHECQSPDDVKALLEGLRARGTAVLSGCHLKKE